jgi:hypothetical protein
MGAESIPALALLDSGRAAEAHALAERVVQKEARAFDTGQYGSDALETLETAEGHAGYLGHLGLVLSVECLGAALREWPRGVSRAGDLDSGPAIFGLSPSGTGLAIGAAVGAGELEAASGLASTAELAGFTLPFGGRHFLVGPLVGDASVTAGLSLALPGCAESGPRRTRRRQCAARWPRLTGPDA